MSSANAKGSTSYGIFAQRSFIKILNRVGDRTAPCGTPIFVFVFVSFTIISLLFSNFMMLLISGDGIPIFFNFYISKGLSTLSKAFRKSIKSINVFFLFAFGIFAFLLTYSLLLASLILSATLAILSSHPTPSLNPL